MGVGSWKLGDRFRTAPGTRPARCAADTRSRRPRQAPRTARCCSLSTQVVKFARLNRLNTSSIGSNENRSLKLKRLINRRSTRCRSFLLKLLRGMIEPIRARAVGDDAARAEHVHAGRRRVPAVVAVEVETAQHHFVRQLVNGVEHRAVHLVARPVPLLVVVDVQAELREVHGCGAVPLRDGRVPRDHVLAASGGLRECRHFRARGPGSPCAIQASASRSPTPASGR